MQFRTTTSSIITVPDDHAQAIFLVLATRWPSVDPNMLARAFLRGPVHLDEFPGCAEACRDRYGVLPRGLPPGLPTLDVGTYASGTFRVTAAPTLLELRKAWGRVRQYGARSFDPVAAAKRYREHHNETHIETLARASS